MINKIHKIECDWCGYYTHLSSSRTESEVEKQAEEWGWVKEGELHFCDEDCKDAFMEDRT